MRVVTANATNPTIIAETLAIEQAIGLKAYIADIAPQRHFKYVLSASVARAAEVLRQDLRGKLSRIEDLHAIWTARLHRGHMFVSRTVTSLALDPRHESLQVELAPVDCSRRMATNTIDRIRVVQLVPQ